MSITRAMRMAVLLVALSGVVVVIGYGLLRRSLPPTTGVRRLAGLQQPVDVVRDAHGIPHLYARTQLDAYAALGYVHAQDRLWQLELNRRAGSGSLSEVFGDVALPHDRLMRALGFRRVAAENLAHLDTPTRQILEAYARGVNAWLRDPELHLPPEFVLLSVHPEPWQPVDSLVVLKAMAWELSGQFDRELLRMRLIERLGVDAARELMSGVPADGEELRDVTGALGKSLDAMLAARTSASSVAIGSNSWAVAGERSASAAPLLANDPHMALSAPALWYLAHLDAPDLTAIGATVPGLPGVIIGRNAYVAWSFTNTRADTEDFYLERVDPDDPQRYLTPDGPARFAWVRERIRVKGKPDELVRVRSTRHGPIVSDAFEQALPRGQLLSLQFTALLPEDHTLQFPLQAAHARNVAELLHAARSFDAPPQNIVSADSAGAVAFVAAGRVPLRAADNGLRGLVPMPGWSARYDWRGFIPYEELPQLTAAPNGRVVTANHNIAPTGYTHWLGADWAPSDRAERIGCLLDARAKHTAATFAEIQRDVRSEAAARLLPLLLAAAPPQADPALLEELSHWNYEFSGERWEPVVFAAWLRELGRLVFEDELDALLPELWGDTPALLEGALQDREGRARVCDDRRTRERETCAQLVALAFERARASWQGKPRWGDVHRARFQHQPFGEIWPLSLLFDVEVPSAGANDTVNLGEYSLPDEPDQFVSRYGPGYRAIYDLAAPERSKFMVAPGQSGHPLSPHYRDLAGAWARGELVPMITERAEVERAATETLTLER